MFQHVYISLLRLERSIRIQHHWDRASELVQTQIGHCHLLLDALQVS